MSNAKTAALVGAGLVGLYLLSGRAGVGAGGGFGGGGADREPGDTIITFPELDLSQLWGDTPAVKEIITAPVKKDMGQAELDIWAKEQPWYEAILPGGGGIGGWFRAQPESTKIRAETIDPRPMPPSIYDAPKKASYMHHLRTALPDPIKLGLTKKRTGRSRYQRSKYYPGQAVQLRHTLSTGEKLYR